MSSRTNELHRHHARAAEQCWARSRHLAAISHVLAAATIAPVRTVHRVFGPSTAHFVWTLALRLFTKPSQ